MSVQEIFQATGASYAPTGMYSFEFRTKNNGFITELFLLLPPESYSIKEGHRSVLAPTLGTGYISDFGNEFKDISFSGSCHYFYAGSPANANKPYITREQDDIFVNGYEEYIKLRFMLVRYRDYTMTPGGRIGKLIVPSIFLTNRGLYSVQALATKVQSYMKRKIGALNDEIYIVWHDYDDDNHFKVKIENFDSTREKTDPFSVKFAVTMKAYEVDDNPFKLPSVPQTIRKKVTMRTGIKKIYLYTGDLSPETAPDTLPVQTSTGTTFVTPTAVT